MKMKTKIKEYDYRTTVVSCACGNTFETRSTKEKISVDICSACHPFYTNKSKIVDKHGQVDKFRRRAAKAKLA